MSDNIDTRITPSLHPDNVLDIEGYDDETRPFLGPTETAFSTAYQALAQIHDARAVVDRDTTRTDDAKILQVDAFARTHLPKITGEFDRVRANLVKQIDAIEKDLNTPVESRAGVAIAAEIRAHVRGMNTGERHTFIRQVIMANDEVSATAIIGAPPYLSGLNDEYRQIYTRMYRETNTPALAKRLKALNGAKELIETRAPLVFAELEKAVGAPPHVAQKLREANTAAERALAVRS